MIPRPLTPVEQHYSDRIAARHDPVLRYRREWIDACQIAVFVIGVAMVVLSVFPDIMKGLFS